MKNLLKSIILASLLGLSVKSSAQLNAAIGFGADTYGKIVYNLSANYQMSRIVISGEIRPSATKNVETNNYLGFKAGYDLFKQPDAELIGKSLLIEGGYYFDKISSDKIILNKWTFAAGIKYVKFFTETGAIFIEPFYLNRSAQLNAGIIVKFI